MRQPHHVAMTGDGVNDLLAMREADCAIAVAEGSDASRQLAQIVLLESDFTHLPQVVGEGRRVIHNVTRTAGVFFIKTVYSLLLSVFCLAAVCYSCIPFTMLRGLVCVGSAVIVTGALFVVPGLLKLEPLSGEMLLPLLCTALLGFVLLAGLELLEEKFQVIFHSSDSSDAKVFH